MAALKLVCNFVDGSERITEYECNFVAECDGTSIWSNTSNKKVLVTGISLIESSYEGGTYMLVNVTHDTDWGIYTDRGFEDAISNALGFAVQFTEQGMQDDNYASMERC